MKMAKFITQVSVCALFTILNTAVQAQTFTHAWLNSAGGSQGDEPVKSAVDVNNNLISLGMFQKTCGFNLSGTVVNKTSIGFSDCYIQKLSPSGNLKWVVAFGSKKEDLIYSVATDNGGNIYATGLFQDTTDFNPGAGVNKLTTKNQSFFILKLDSNGNFLWVKQIDGTIETVTNILVTKDQNILLTGTYTQSVDFDPDAGITKLTVSTSYVQDARNAFLCKYNSTNGSLMWAKEFRTDKNTIELTNASIDKDGNIISCGYYDYIADFDPGTATRNHNVNGTGFQEGFVVKLSSDGNYVWARSFTASSMQIYCCNTDDSNNIWLGGSFYAMVDFDPSTGEAIESTSNTDVFIFKLDKDGFFVLVKIIKTSAISTSTIRSLFCDKKGNVYIGGEFRDSVDFDPGATKKILRSGNYIPSSFIAKYNNSGNLIQAYKIGTGTESVTSPNILLGQKGSIYHSGIYRETINFAINSAASNSTPAGESDAYMQKIDCNISHSISQSGGILTVNISGAKLQWINCSTGARIAGETGTTFIAKTNGNYAVMIEKGECTVVSDCKTITAASTHDLSRQSVLQFAPNPAENTIQITQQNINFNQIKIMDVNGKTILEIPLNTGQDAISIGQLQAGIYILEATDSNQKKYQAKLIKL